MSQYKTGTVTVTNGSATVTGSGTSWSANVAAGDLFTIIGSSVPYIVGSVGSDTSLTLTSTYAGVTASAQSYAITTSFTPILGIPYMEQGDLDTATIYKRGMLVIEDFLNTTSFVNLTITGNTTIGDAAGDTLTINAGTTTFSQGTANGVLYLNGSKVATSGSALTFDGNRLALAPSSATANRIDILNDTGNATFRVGYDTSNNLTITRNAGDANIYLNATQSGAAQVWQLAGSEQMRLTSTGLGIGTSSPGAKLDVRSSFGSAVFGIIGTSTATNPGAGLVIAGSGNTNKNWVIANQYNVNGGLEFTQTTAAAGTTIGSTPSMVLDSSGNLGIGTSSPAAKLEVSGATQATGAVVRLTNSAESSSWAAGNVIGQFDFYSSDSSDPATKSRIASVVESGGTHPTAVGLAFSTYNTSLSEKMRLDSSGNLGLGVTPSAWTTFKAFEFGTANGHSLFASGGVGGETHLGTNVYYNSGYKYANNDYATDYKQTNGVHSWFIAPSGTAGNAITFTQAMTLDASGNLGLGTTSPTSITGTAHVLDVVGSSYGFGLFGNGTVTAQICGDGANSISLIGSRSNHPVAFITNNTERARIDSSGNLLVGTTSGSGKVNVNNIGNGGVIITQSTVGSFSFISNVIPLASVGYHVQFLESSTPTGSITSTGGVTAYNTTSDYRAKDIIGPVQNSGVLIDSVPVYMGKMKGATQERPMFIAHETPAYAHTGEKDAVDADGNPVYQQMDASALIPVMWAEIQSLRARVATLES